MTDPSLDRPGAAPVVVVLGNCRAALTTARRLSAAGCRIILGAEPGTYCAEHSRFVDEVWHCPPFVAGSPALLAALRDLLNRLPARPTILPVVERPLDAIASFEDELAPAARLAMPRARVLSIFHDKYRTLTFAAEAGLDVPAFGLARDIPELTALTREIGGTVVVRPIVAGTRIGTSKAVSLEDAQAIPAAIGGWPEGLPAMLVQRRFSGKRTNVYFAARDGLVLAEQHSLSLRTDRLDGTGQTIEGVTIAPIAPISRDVRRLARAADYTGVGCAQFLYDEAAGKSCFLEINPRFGASYAFVEQAGMGLTRLAFDLAWNDPQDVPDRSDRFDAGTGFVWTLGDVSGLLAALRKGEAGAGAAGAWAASALMAALRARVHVTWSIHDPMPTLYLYGRGIASTLKLRKRGSTSWAKLAR